MLLSSSDIFALTGSFANHFEIFSHNRNRLITVYKEPIKQINNISSSPVYGYGEQSNLQNITYIPVTGIFPAQINYFNSDSKMLEDINVIQSTSEARIKVEENAKNFINDGRKNEKIEFEGLTFNFLSDDPVVLNYQGLKYYTYRLQITS